jgi:hypothetical protein
MKAIKFKNQSIMQPSEITISWILFFLLCVLVAFAYNNPEWYQKIENWLLWVLWIVAATFYWINLWTGIAITKIEQEKINEIAHIAWSFHEDLFLIFWISFLVFIFILWLWYIHILKDKK